MRVVLALVVSVGFIWLSLAITLALESRAMSDKKADRDRLTNALLAQSAKITPSPAPLVKKPKTVSSPVSKETKSVQDCQKVTNTLPEVPEANAEKPGLNEDTTYNYYTVYGSTPNEIYAQTKKCGPDTLEGIFEGSTDYRIRWSYKYSWDNQENCKITSVAVGLKVKINLPKWERPEGVAQTTIDYWDTSSANLKDHEGVHRQISIDAAGKILKSLQELPIQNCQQIEQSSESMAMSIYDQIIVDQSELDARTNHGANQI